MGEREEKALNSIEGELRAAVTRANPVDKGEPKAPPDYPNGHLGILSGVRRVCPGEIEASLSGQNLLLTPGLNRFPTLWSNEHGKSPYYDTEKYAPP